MFEKYQRVKVICGEFAGDEGYIISARDDDGDYKVDMPSRDTWNFVHERNIQAYRNTVDLEYVRSGKIPAIKAVREITGMGLKDAKDLVDAIMYNANKNYSQRARINDLELEIERLNTKISSDAAHTREIYEDARADRAELAELKIAHVDLQTRMDTILDMLTREQLIALIKG